MRLLRTWLDTRTERALVEMFDDLDMRTGLKLADVTAAQLEYWLKILRKECPPIGRRDGG